jgi:hypothetical protein
MGKVLELLTKNIIQRDIIEKIFPGMIIIFTLVKCGLLDKFAENNTWLYIIFAWSIGFSLDGFSLWFFNRHIVKNYKTVKCFFQQYYDITCDRNEKIEDFSNNFASELERIYTFIVSSSNYIIALIFSTLIFFTFSAIGQMLEYKLNNPINLLVVFILGLIFVHIKLIERLDLIIQIHNNQ